VGSPDPFGLLGQVLDGQFRVDRYVGEGGFSSVYHGTHVGLSEPIAIKCLKLPSALGSALVESFVRRFRDESRIHYKLSQGNLHVVRSIASGTVIAPATSALVPYTVLEWLEGRSLAEEFDERKARGLRGRPLAEVVRLMDSAALAIAHAHAQGVVHRDLNPGNLFLAKTAAGTKLKVLDFGVAKILADSALMMGPGARTVGNVRMFAPAYGAPEQFDERVGAIGPWTDVYALALVALEAMTDRDVVDGDHVGEFALRALDPARRPTPRALGVAVGDEVEVVMRRAVEVDPRERPHDAGELWGMLKHAMRVDGESGRPPHAHRPESEPPPPATLRMDTPVPSGATSPVVELVRRPSEAPALPRGAALGGTLRLPRAPRSGFEALAQTPFPSNAPPPMALPATDDAPSTVPLPALSPAASAPLLAAPAPAATVPMRHGTPLPAPVVPPPILYPAAAAASALGPVPARGARARYVALAVLLAGLVAAGTWVLLSRAG
jgi:serine/threonine protein kinase